MLSAPWLLDDGRSRPPGLPRRRFGGGDAEENFAGLNCQEGQADAALDDEFFANPQRVLLHGCASVRLGRVRALMDRAVSGPPRPLKRREGKAGVPFFARRVPVEVQDRVPVMSIRSRRGEFSGGIAAIPGETTVLARTLPQAGPPVGRA